MSLTPQPRTVISRIEIFYSRVTAVIGYRMIANKLAFAVLALVVLLAIAFMPPFFFKLGL